MFFVMPLLLSVPIGKFSDKNGRGKVMLAGIIIALLGLWTFHLAQTLFGLVVGMVALFVSGFAG